jgi:hypothetical protein
MKIEPRKALLAGLLAAASAMSYSQRGSGTTATAPDTSAPPAQGAGPAAGPGMGMGRTGQGRGMGPMRFGSDTTPGWSFMSEQERTEHRIKMRSMKTYGECRSYMDEHHAQMAKRAKERGQEIPDKPLHDPCLRLKGGS